MKPQDILFFIVLMVLIFIKKSNWIVIAALLCIGLALPLFAKHIFFTAQHLTYYAWGFLLVAVLFKFYENRH